MTDRHPAIVHYSDIEDPVPWQYEHDDEAMHYQGQPNITP